MPLAAPTNLRLGARGLYVTGSSGSYGTAARVPLSWDFDYTGITGPVTFTIRRLVSGTVQGTSYPTTTSTKSLVNGLAVNAPYTSFQVQASHGTLGTSAWSSLSPEVFTSDPLPVDDSSVPPLTNVVVALVTDTSVQIDWDYASNNVTTVTISAASADGGALPAIPQETSLGETCLITGLTAGKSYTFSLLPQSSYAASTTAIQTFGNSVVQAYVVMATPSDTAPIAGPSIVYCDKGAPLDAQWSFLGLGAVSTWAATGLGEATLETLGADQRLARLTGVFTTAGIKQALIYCRRTIGLQRQTFAYPVKICVTDTGLGGCLGWLHDDPTRLDLQLDALGRAVYSFASHAPNSATAALQLTRGDTQRLYVIPRDSGGNFLPTALTKLGFILRLRDRRDGAPLLYLPVSDPLLETIAGRSVAYLDVTPANRLLDTLFTALNSGPGADLAAASLACDAELVWKLGTQPIRTSRLFPVEIVQDSER